MQDLYEIPAYGIVEAALYLRVPYQTLRYWLTGYGKMAPIVHLASTDPPRLSFTGLLECHVLTGMRKIYDLKLPRVRRALLHLGKNCPVPHPLINEIFFTDSKDLFVEKFGQMINLSRAGQIGFDFMYAHYKRIERDPKGLFKFFPFVMQRSEREPKSIEINPFVGFGKPVIAGTAISTAIIASRFNARESVSDLAAEYGCTPEQIEEAVRWERTTPIAA